MVSRQAPGGPLNHRRGAQVFAFFTDPSPELQWRGQVKEIRAEGPPAVVARIDRVAMGQTESGPRRHEVSATTDDEVRRGAGTRAGEGRPRTLLTVLGRRGRR